MRTLNSVSKIAAIVLVAAITFRCGDDDPAPANNFTISGAVTYPDASGSAMPADGAIVYLKKGATEATTEYDLTTVADVAGVYTFEEVPDGDYFLFANFDTNNNNNPSARTGGIMFSGEGAIVAVLGADVSQPLALVSMGQIDAVAVDTYEGGGWSNDWSHSNVEFEFPYDAENATYRGGFSKFEIFVDFQPTNLGASKIMASIDGLSINTNSPGGRDPLYNSDGSFWEDPEDFTNRLGCVSGYFGIPDIAAATRYATFESSSIEVYGDGYLAKGPMTFRGVTSNIEFIFKYIPGFQAENRSEILTQYSSFEGAFDFAALDAFGLDSGHVQDSDVTVKVSLQVNQPVN